MWLAPVQLPAATCIRSRVAPESGYRRCLLGIRHNSVTCCSLVGAPVPTVASPTLPSPARLGFPALPARSRLWPSLPSIPPELTAVALVYFVQGIMELATLAQTYHLKDELHANPAQVALFLSVSSIPWTIKPLIGFVSDTVPLWGYRRRSYLLLASMAGTASYVWMARGPPSAMGFLGAMLLCSAASAVSDVVVDSMVVERARGETQDAAGSLQSLCWASYAVAQVVTASLSGTLVQEFGPRTVFELTALFPLLVGGASVLLREERADSQDSSSRGSHSNHNSSSGSGSRCSDSSDYSSSDSKSGGSSNSSGSSCSSSSGSSKAEHVNQELQPSNNFSTSAMSTTTTTAITASTTAASDTLVSLTGEKTTNNPGAEAEAGSQSASTSAAMAQAGLLWAALQRPSVAGPLSFLLLLSATPSADSALFFYQTEQLHFSASFLGQVQLAGACASFAGVFLYNSVLKRVPMRSLLLWGTLLAAALQGSQLVLVSGAHRQWGLDDHMFVLGGSVVLDAVKNVLYMPTMVLAARLCPPGLEATMFATIMSLSNLADGLRVGGGAALMTALNVGPEDWSGLPTLLAVCNAGLLLPLTLLGQVPADGVPAGGSGDGAQTCNTDSDMPADSQQAAIPANVPPDGTDDGAHVRSAGSAPQPCPCSLNQLTRSKSTAHAPDLVLLPAVTEMSANLDNDHSGQRLSPQEYMSNLQNMTSVVVTRTGQAQGAGTLTPAVMGSIVPLSSRLSAVHAGDAWTSVHGRHSNRRRGQRRGGRRLGRHDPRGREDSRKNGSQRMNDGVEKPQECKVSVV